ncbi:MULTISPECIES: FAD-binding oxidoreductase [unclassified Mesorhizobium]|uniref:NAD(P)/FAD-dependent oxidoreductase n=2 Tax=unclassified Mesorhizobium TaxID=325217 RepID=UPI0024795D55|nr:MULTISPECIES: FAD-binding oxidoreductase [unclassified Mesorhizobium]
MSAKAKVFATSSFPTHPGVSGWVAMLPPRIERPQLEGALTVDFVVIGAGFAGLSAARRLSQLDPGLKVAVLEAGVVGEGPAGRNSGFIIDLPHEVSSDDFSGDSSKKSKQDIAIYRRAISLGKELAEEQGWDREIFDPCGRYSMATTAEGDRHLVAYSEQLRLLGEDHQFLGAAETAAVTGTETFTSAIFTPGTVIVQPAAYVRAIADSFRGPVKVFERTPAISFEQSGAGWLVKTPKGSVRAAKIILANNGHAQGFGFFRRQLLHVYTYASLTREFDPRRLAGERKWAATPALPMGTTVRRINTQGGDRILVRSRYSYHPGLNAGDREVASAGILHERKFAARFPALKDVGMEHRWGGAMALTWNSVPAFGEVEQGVFAACGCNGLGASKATASGIAAAEVATGVQTDLTRIFASFPPPRMLPPQPITTLGAKVQMAVREWRAGLE